MKLRQPSVAILVSAFRSALKIFNSCRVSSSVSTMFFLKPRFCRSPSSICRWRKLGNQRVHRKPPSGLSSILYSFLVRLLDQSYCLFTCRRRRHHRCRFYCLFPPIYRQLQQLRMCARQTNMASSRRHG